MTGILVSIFFNIFFVENIEDRTKDVPLFISLHPRCFVYLNKVILKDIEIIFYSSETSSKIKGNIYAGTLNYFGNNKRITNITCYKEIIFESLWENIDLYLISMDKDELEMQFVLHPGADPEDIKLFFKNSILKFDREGICVIKEGKKIFYISSPEAYQGEKKIGITPIIERVDSSGYLLSYKVYNYDSSWTLIIDPVISYILASTSGNDFASVCRVYAQEYIYIGGTIGDAYSYIPGNNFGNLGSTDAFVSKFNLYGQHISTAILASPSEDEVLDIKFDDNGNLVISGTTKDAENFCPERTIYGTISPGEEDCFVTKLSNDLSGYIKTVILASSEKDEANGVAVGYDGTIFVVGEAGNGEDFVCTSCQEKTSLGESEGASEVFVTKLSGDLGNHIMTLLLTSDDLEEAYDIAIDNSNYIFVAGRTKNYEDFAGDHEYYGGEPWFKVGYSGFITKLDYNLNYVITGILACDIVSDVIRAIAIGPDGSVFVGGLTEDPSSFPKDPKYYHGESDDEDAFIVKLSNDLENHSSTAILCSVGKDKIYDVLIDDLTGTVLATGYTEGTNSFAPERVIFGQPGGSEVFISRLNYNLDTHIKTALVVSPGDDYAYEIDIDPYGNIYLCGETYDPLNFSTERYFYGNSGLKDAFFSILDADFVKINIKNKKERSSFSIASGTPEIKLYINNYEYVGFSIYESSGRVVKRVSLGMKHKGLYKIPLNLKKGIYFIKLRTGSEVKICRIIISK